MEKQKGKMTKTTFKEKSMKKQSLVTKEASNRQHQPKEDPTTLTTHPATSHNIKLTKREDVHDCLKNNYVYRRLLAKNPRGWAYVRDFWPKNCVYRLIYMTFGQNPVYIGICTRLLAKKLRI